ncbi:mitochondrial distribution and morphology protein 10 [Suillus cothurnatus]|nr:mitochondrial distribution and morphology protein 10 [Suillus cothurnatus]
MHPFASYVLRSYYRATGWNEDNLYANLTRSSNAILDFSVPPPNGLFNTSYSMNAMPSLNGSVGYIFTSCNLDVKSSGSVHFKDMVERFKVYDQPRRPEGKDEEWLAGERTDTRDYLLYGRLYLPTGRLDALYSTRLSPTLQALVAAISDPRSSLSSEKRSRGDNVSNVMFSLQHDIGKWCSEYTYSAEDGMWGMRVLHNFGRLRNPTEPPEDLNSSPGTRPKRVDEEEATGGGLKGRVSAGAEFYISAKERSAGARVSRDLSMCSRFDFNVYSYDSEWTMGAEWWMRRAVSKHEDELEPSVISLEPPSVPVPQTESLDIPSDIRGVVKARISTNNNVSLMWEGRLKQMLVSLGFVSDLSSRSKPIKAIGLELSYFSAG